MDPAKKFPLNTVKHSNEEEEKDRIIFLWCCCLVCGTALILCAMFAWVMSWFAPIS